MRIRRIRLRNYRGVDECDIDFNTDGITIVEGPNEVGKSSLIEAIDLLFKQPSESTSKGVKAVRPLHRDADPEVEAVLEMGEYELTYRKRFGSGRRGETTLQIAEPRAESSAGREAHERMREILGETLDEGLWQALRFEQGSEIAQPGLGGSVSLQAALDAAAGGTPANALEDTLFAKVKDEFERYFTPTGKRKKEVQEQEDAVRELEDREGDLEADMRSLDELTSTAERLAKERDRLEMRLAEAEAEAADLGAELEAVNEKAAAIEQLEAELAKAEADLSPVRDEMERRRQLARSEKQYAEEEAGLAEEHAAAERDVAAAKTHLDQAITRYKQAASASDEAARIARIRQKDFDFARGKLDLRMMGERLARVDEAERKIAEAQEVLNRSLVDDDALERLRELDREVGLRRATLKAGSPSVRLDPHTDCSIVIDGEPEHLRAGRAVERVVTAEATFEIPSRLSIRVRPGTSAESASRALEKAETEIAGLLTELGVADLAEAERFHAERREAAETVKHAEKQIRVDLGDLTLETLKQKTTALERFVNSYPAERPAEPPMAADRDSARELSKAAEEDEKKAVYKRAEAEAERDQAQSRYEMLNRQLIEHQADYVHLRGRLTQLREELEEARQQQSDKAIEEDLRAKERDAQDKTARLEAARREYEALQPDEVRARAENSVAVVDRCKEEREGVANDLRDARVRLETLGAEGTAEQLADVRSKLEHKRRDWESLLRRAHAAEKLYETMDACRTEAFQRYRAPLRDKIEELGRIVFGEGFSVELGEDLGISDRTLDGVTVPFEQLSVGAREQLSILARLATATLVDPDSGVPVVLDDALGYSDPDRLEALGAVIRTVAARRQCQLILLTCYPDRYRFIGDAVTVKLPQETR